MHRPFSLALALVLSGAVSAALACAPGTVALIEQVAAMTKPPMFRCGPKFNEMLANAHKNDWKGALAAYEAHLAGLWQMGGELCKRLRDAGVLAAEGWRPVAVGAHLTGMHRS